MKNLFYPVDSIENKITYFHLIGFLISLPFDRFYSSIILISFLIHVIIHLKRRNLQHLNYNILIMQSVFYVSLIGSLYAASFSGALNIISKQLAIFIFPITFAVMSFKISRYRDRLLMGFSIACTLTVLYLYVDALRVIRYNHLSLRALFSDDFINHNFSLPIDMHATYLAVFLVMALVYFIKEYFSCKKLYLRILFIIGSLILLSGLLQLGSKSALTCLLLIIIIGFSFLLFNGQKRMWFFTLSVGVSVLLIIFILSINILRQRFLLDFRKELHYSTAMVKQFTRLDRWRVAVELIKRSPVAGYGTGSEIPLLKEEYFDRKMYDPYLKSMNAHNQYLGFLINSGIIGLLVYVSTLGWGIKLAIKRKDILFFSFMVLVSVVSLSEDIMDVNKGIFFYAFFFPFFAMDHRTMDEKKNTKATLTVDDRFLKQGLKIIEV